MSANNQQLTLSYLNRDAVKSPHREPRIGIPCMDFIVYIAERNERVLHARHDSYSRHYFCHQNIATKRILPRRLLIGVMDVRKASQTRLCKQESLKQGDVVGTEPAIFVQRFNTLGDDFDAKVLAHLNDCAHYALARSP